MTPKETNNNKEFYVRKFADYQTRNHQAISPVRIETLVRKAYSLNTHDYKNTKMTEILMMTLTPQLRKIAIKKRASHPSSISRTRFRFSKTSRQTRTRQAEITMKLEETENLKLQYVNRIETNTHKYQQHTGIRYRPR